MLSDSLKWKGGFSWKRWVNIVKTDVFEALVWKVDIERIDMRSFSTEGIGLKGHMGLTFSKKVGFQKVEIRKMSTNIRKWSEMGPEKWSRGLERSGKVKIALRIHWEASRRPNSPLKIQKMQKTVKIRKIKDFPYFPISGVGPIRPIFLYGASRSLFKTGLATGWDDSPDMRGTVSS